MTPAIGTLWSAAGVLVGFQVAALTLRINREIDVGKTRDLTWLTVADGINVVSMSITLIGVFALPVVDVIHPSTASKLFGLAVVLLVGYAFTIAGHYEMYNWTTSRSYDPFPFQEKVASAIVALAAISYIALAIVR